MGWRLRQDLERTKANQKVIDAEALERLDKRRHQFLLPAFPPLGYPEDKPIPFVMLAQIAPLWAFYASLLTLCLITVANVVAAFAHNLLTPDDPTSLSNAAALFPSIFVQLPLKLSVILILAFYGAMFILTLTMGQISDRIVWNCRARQLAQQKSLAEKAVVLSDPTVWPPPPANPHA